MRHLIVFLPGIMGSALQKDGQDVWALSGEGLWHYLTSWGGSVQGLAVAQDDGLTDDLGDGIKAARLIEDLHSVPGLIEHAGYGLLSRRIPEFFEITPGSIHAPRDEASFFPFPYDWRRDNRVSARGLQRFVETQLPRWRTWSGARDAQVILIGHSMGGLVARYYVEALGGWKHCRALITIGTPHRGALGALDTISNGFKKLSFDFSGLVRSFASIYQLLPIYPAVQIDGRFVRVAEADSLPNVDSARAAAARTNFHEVIRLEREAHLHESGYRQLLIPWVGTRQDTWQSATLAQGHLVPSYQPPMGLDASLADGDGTVPRVSTVPAGLENQQLERFAVERHGWLTNAENTLEPLLDTLQQVGAAAVPGDFRGALESQARATIGLRLPSVFYDTPEPTVTVRVRGATTSMPLRIDVRSVSVSGTEASSQRHETSVEPDGSVEVSLAGLRAGLYTLTARPVDPTGPRAPTAVHGLFEVVT